MKVFCPCCRDRGEIHKAFWPPLALRRRDGCEVGPPPWPPEPHRVPCPDCRPAAYEQACRGIYEREDGLHEEHCRVRRDRARTGRPGAICTCKRGRTCADR